MSRLMNDILTSRLERVLFFLTISFLIVAIFNPEISFAAGESLESQLEKGTAFLVNKPLALFMVFAVVFGGGALAMAGQWGMVIKLIVGVFGLGIAAILAKDGAFLKLLT